MLEYFVGRAGLIHNFLLLEYYRGRPGPVRQTENSLQNQITLPTYFLPTYEAVTTLYPTNKAGQVQDSSIKVKVHNMNMSIRAYKQFAQHTKQTRYNTYT